MILILEDELLRYIFNDLDFKAIKNISISCKTFHKLNFTHQIIPHGLYYWIYGVKELENKNIYLDRFYLKSEYSFNKYLNDLIAFLEYVTTYYDEIKHFKSHFKNIKINENGDKVLIHDIYNVTLEQYYGSVLHCNYLKALIY